MVNRNCGNCPSLGLVPFLSPVASLKLNVTPEHSREATPFSPHHDGGPDMADLTQCETSLRITTGLSNKTIKPS